jgi:adenylosuccinate lyase
VKELSTEICPLEWRYGSKEMRKLFTREEIMRRRLEVEVAIAYGLAKAGIVEEWVPEKIKEAVCKVEVSRVDELEAKLGHDIMALATALAEKSGEAGKYVHLGATSYDIVDTAWSLIMRDALKILEEKTVKVINKLIEYSIKYKNTIMAGRTHGQHAVPITLGFKFANYVYEFTRSLERMHEMEKRLIRSKISGAVGNMASWKDKGLIIEGEASRILELKPHEISTQIAPRDGFAELVANIAILGSQLDRLALEIRELMRPEIGELAEGVKGRVGSSTMPQKANPVTSEKICGLAKVLRSMVIIALENIPLWHERDLTNSSSERFLISHTILTLDEMLDSMMEVLENLVVNVDNMKRNLEITRGTMMSENVLMKLVERGMARTEAHEILREITRRVALEKIEFKDALLQDNRIMKLLKREEVEELLKPENYLGETEKLIERAIKYAKETISKITHTK